MKRKSDGQYRNQKDTRYKGKMNFSFYTRNAAKYAHIWVKNEEKI